MTLRSSNGIVVPVGAVVRTKGGVRCYLESVSDDETSVVGVSMDERKLRITGAPSFFGLYSTKQESAKRRKNTNGIKEETNRAILRSLMYKPKLEVVK